MLTLPPIDTRYHYRLLRRESEPPRGSITGGGDRHLDAVDGRAPPMSSCARVQDVDVRPVVLALGPAALGGERDAARARSEQRRLEPSRPRRWRPRTASPSARPRSAASAGCSATVAGPSRRVTFASLAKLSFSSHGDAGDSSRSRLAPGAGRPAAAGRAAVRRASAAAEAISTRPLGVGNASSANWTTGSARERHRPRRGQRLEVAARRPCREHAAMISASALVQLGSSKPIAAASRRKISWFGSASPSGSAALTWADRVRSK